MLTALFYTSLAMSLREQAREGGVSIAVGEGRAAWDSTPPNSDRAITALVAEVARRSVSPDDVVFLDVAGQPTERPTPRLRFAVTFEAGEGTGTLRECGLLGGTTEEPASGRLLSYHMHPRLEKGAEATLRRAVSIDLTPQPIVPGTRATRYLGNTATTELHDLDNEQPNCQIDEVRFDRQYYFANIEAARAAGYDFCAYCFGRERSER